VVSVCLFVCLRTVQTYLTEIDIIWCEKSNGESQKLLHFCDILLRLFLLREQTVFVF